MTPDLLDTNILSEAYRPRPHPGVVDWLAQLPDGAGFISAITIGEIHKGIVKLRPTNLAKAARLEAWLHTIETLQANTILPIDTAIAKRWAELRVARPQGNSEDLLIAATALVHGLTVATRNVRDFADLGVPLHNPFEPAGGGTP
ncbi:type II toxin-antitoxin system VapC family toxin [Azospirillum sp.]|uniref:type II toxin-antitoxin system VapC family toxin n=1 Tax=Azospirillum sp. TaxID=34012 RepID=UPI002D71D944|nr:type II toxin-antitoxin system VapC family toxin [Azospirillum sp.]HYD70306.1 type II toxin-antitoxin system VapC family toxin [Azospirillum sp.]